MVPLIALLEDLQGRCDVYRSAADRHRGFDCVRDGGVGGDGQVPDVLAEAREGRAVRPDCRGRMPHGLRRGQEEGESVPRELSMARRRSRRDRDTASIPDAHTTAAGRGGVLSGDAAGEQHSTDVPD